MKVILMGKEKPSVVAALEHLLAIGVQVVAAVVPASVKQSSGKLGTVLRDSKIPQISDTQLYSWIAGDFTIGCPFELRSVDLVLSFLFWKRIKQPIIELPRIACINFHPAPLPDFRGVCGYSFAIFEQLSVWGVSAHFVDPAFDTGDLIKVNTFPIDGQVETSYSLEKKSQQELLRLFKEVICIAKESDALPRTPQTEGRYISRSDFEAMRMVNPDDSAEVVSRKIRACWYPPFAGAAVVIDGKEFTVVDDSVLRELGEIYEKSPTQ